MPKFACLACLAGLAALLGALPAGAATVFVAQEGIDGGSCGARTSPCRSISKGLEIAGAGDTVVVGPGLYGDLDGDGSFSTPGEEAAELGSGCNCMLHVTKRVTIVSEAGAAATVLDGSSMAPTLVDIAADGVVFGRRSQGFTLTGAGPNQVQGAIETEAATSGVTIAGNVMTSNTGLGVWVFGSDHEILDNRASDNYTAGFLVAAAGTALARNVASANGVGFELDAPDITLEDDVASANGVGFNVTNFAQTPTFTRCSALGNRDAGFNVGDVPIALDGGRVTGNGTTGATNCGLQILGTGALDARGVYWGAASGPGPDPADEVCAGMGGTVVTTPVAAKPKRLRVKPMR